MASVAPVGFALPERDLYPAARIYGVSFDELAKRLNAIVRGGRAGSLRYKCLDIVLDSGRVAAIRKWSNRSDSEIEVAIEIFHYHILYEDDIDEVCALVAVEKNSVLKALGDFKWRKSRKTDL